VSSLVPYLLNSCIFWHKIDKKWCSIYKGLLPEFNVTLPLNPGDLGVKQQQSSRIAELGVKPRSGLFRLGIILFVLEIICCP